MKLVFDRFVTSGRKEYITVFKRNEEDGSYSHKTYTSLRHMPEEERIAYLQTHGFPNILKDIIDEHRDNLNQYC